MILPVRYLSRLLHGSIDFDTSKDKFFNLQYGEFSTWYCSIDQLLEAADRYCKIGRYRCWLYRRRYFNLTRRK